MLLSDRDLKALHTICRMARLDGDKRLYHAISLAIAEGIKCGERNVCQSLRFYNEARKANQREEIAP